MALDLIDEDPNQPREDFDPVALQELADSIKAEGDVLQPISLRPNPDVPGRYIINFGHRRYRAMKLLGRPDIPYFVVRQISTFAQVIENEQRQNLSPMELATFIRDRMAEGFTQQEIARRLGKSKALVSKTASLNEAPVIIIEALQAGRLGGVTEAYELAKLHAQHPQAVTELVAQQKEIPRAAIIALRERLQATTMEAELDVEWSPAADQTVDAEPPAPATGVKTPNAPAPAKPAPAAGQTATPRPAAPMVMAEYKGQPLVLDVSTVPPYPGHFYGRRPGSPRRLTAPATEVRLVGFAAE